MALDLSGIINENEFYSHHYLQAILEDDLRDLFAEWDRREKEEGAEHPADTLSRLARPYFVMRGRYERGSESRESQTREFIEMLLPALGYEVKPRVVEHSK